MPMPTEAPPSLRQLIGGDIACVFQRDPAARSRWEVLTTYPGVHAVLLHRLAHRLWRLELRYPARLLSFLARLWSNVDIHPGARIGRRFFIDHGAGVVIGETAEIGDDVTLYHGVTLGGTTWNKGKRHPTLGNGVVVGAGAKILGPIELGDRVRVGANSVVVHSVAADRTVVGIPGKEVVSPKTALNGEEGINLDHHLIPDPVGKLIASLIQRLDRLEHTAGAPVGEVSRGAPLAAVQHDLHSFAAGSGEALPPLSAAVSRLLEKAAILYPQMEAENLLLEAWSLASDHPQVLGALYRFYFYRHRLDDALGVAERTLCIGAAHLQLKSDWQALQPADLAGRQDDMQRLYLLALKACAYLELRLGRCASAKLRLEALCRLDPENHLGGAYLLSLADLSDYDRTSNAA
jgi:serine O-acetyltransferase